MPPDPAQTTLPAQAKDLATKVRQLTTRRRTPPGECPHRPERIWCWWAYNWRTGKNDIFCAACCDCGAVLAGAAEEEVA